MAFLTEVVRPETTDEKKKSGNSVGGNAFTAFSRRRQRRYK